MRDSQQSYERKRIERESDQKAENLPHMSFMRHIALCGHGVGKPSDQAGSDE